GVEPDRVDPEPGEVVEFRDHARDVSDAVAVRVRERARIDLVEHALPPPGHAGDPNPVDGSSRFRHRDWHRPTVRPRHETAARHRDRALGARAARATARCQSPGRGRSSRGRAGRVASPPVEGFPFVHRELARYRDADAFGHVNNAVYLTYLEQA